MQDHNANLASQRSYKCNYCPKSFTNSSYLSQHLRIHLGLRPYGPCPECGKSFTQLSHLQQHIRTHSGERPYRCQVEGCTKAYTQLCNLQMHSRTHQADKNFRCKSCYKSFVDEVSLMAHIPTHLDTKHRRTSICLYCGKSYAQARYLPVHIRKQHDNELNRIQQQQRQAKLAEQLKMISSPALFPEQDREIGLFRPENNEQMQINQQDGQLLTPNINVGTPLPCRTDKKVFQKVRTNISDCGMPNGLFSSYNPINSAAMPPSSDPRYSSFNAYKWNGLRNQETGQCFATRHGHF